MPELLFRIAILVVAIAVFIIVIFAHAYLLEKRFPLREKQVRWNLILLQVISLTWVFTAIAVWRALKEPTSDTLIILALSVLVLACSYFLQFWPGADLDDQGIIFRRFYGRKIYVRWRDIIASRLTWYSSLLRIETSDGRKLGLQVVNRGIWPLWEELVKRNVPSPTEEDLKAAIERQQRG
ncbi:MAG: hypothetical protein AAGI14_08940 [Pseudomonadota bacterium]